MPSSPSSATRDATVMRSPRTATGEQPLLAAAREPVQQQRASTAQGKDISESFENNNENPEWAWRERKVALAFVETEDRGITNVPCGKC